jgi:hypothetical protein
VRVHRGTKGHVWLSQVGAVLSLAALLILVEQSARSNPWNLAVLGGLVVLSLVIEVLYRHFSPSREGRGVLASSQRPGDEESQ